MAGVPLSSTRYGVHVESSPDAVLPKRSAPSYGGGGGSDVNVADGSGLQVIDGVLDLSGRGGATFSVHVMSVTGKDGKVSQHRVLSDSDIRVEQGGGGVTSLNGETGDISITGGKKIEVSTDGKTIKVSYNADKEDPKEKDPDTNTNCDDHPGSEPGGGVSAGDGGGPAGPAPAGGGGSSGVGC